jgi:glycosyltransferase involved in cell wall biosynthesis
MHPQWSFALIGPEGNLGEDAALVKQLSQLPNVYFFGRKPVSALPAYIQHMDVCMMCYKVNDYTKYIYPLKLHEYLASGRPVVGSPIPVVQEFAHVIRIARTTDEWSQALKDSLAPESSSAAQVEARRSVARRYDWNKLAKTMAYTLCDRLGSSYLERFKKIIPSEHGALRLPS